METKAVNGTQVRALVVKSLKFQLRFIFSKQLKEKEKEKAIQKSGEKGITEGKKDDKRKKIVKVKNSHMISDYLNREGTERN